MSARKLVKAKRHRKGKVPMQEWIAQTPCPAPRPLSVFRVTLRVTRYSLSYVPTPQPQTEVAVGLAESFEGARQLAEKHVIGGTAICVERLGEPWGRP